MRSLKRCINFIAKDNLDLICITQYAKYYFLKSLKIVVSCKECRKKSLIFLIEQTVIL